MSIEVTVPADQVQNAVRHLNNLAQRPPVISPPNADGCVHLGYPAVFGVSPDSFIKSANEIPGAVVSKSA